jgi:hypothetical protein
MRVVLVWLLVSYDPHTRNINFLDETVFAAYTTKSACEAAAERYDDKQWRDEKLGRYGPKMPAWFPLTYSCTEAKVDPK